MTDSGETRAQIAEWIRKVADEGERGNPDYFNPPPSADTIGTLRNLADNIAAKDWERHAPMMLPAPEQAPYGYLLQCIEVRERLTTTDVALSHGHGGQVVEIHGIPTEMARKLIPGQAVGFNVWLRPAP